MTALALVLGEALVDVVHRDQHRVAHSGGSPLNVAVGLARLGVATTLHSSIGRDEYGRMLAAHLDRNSVELTPNTVSDVPTSVALATIGDDGAADYDFTVAWDPAELPGGLGDFAVVHTGSIGAALEPGASLVERVLGDARGRSVVTFDPNIRPALFGEHREALSRVERLVALSDVVKASDEDVRWLYPDATPTEVLHHWLELGAAFAVVTKGAEGAVSATSAGATSVPAPLTTVADTIGAGDSFTAGMIAAMLDLDLLGRIPELSPDAQRNVLTFAARCAAMTTSRTGANPPTRADLDTQAG